MAFLIKVCIHFNSKFSLTSKYLGTNAIVVKRVYCKRKVMKLFFFIELAEKCSGVFTFLSGFNCKF